MLFLLGVYGPLAIFPISESDQLLYGDAKHVSTQQNSVLKGYLRCPLMVEGWLSLNAVLVGAADAA
jgi:hypothetical protein